MPKGILRHVSTDYTEEGIQGESKAFLCVCHMLWNNGRCSYGLSVKAGFAR